MSCNIRTTANITDVEAVRRCLFPTDDSRGSDSWLQVCEISVSPIGDIIAIANGRRLVVLSAKWDAETLLSQFQITYSGSIHESDNIRAVLCLPLVGQAKSSHIGFDWTCILLGFESGFLRFYTENCDLLLEEQLHNEVITSVKCQSQHSPQPDISPELHPEEVYVQYQSNVCVVAGNQLFPILRTRRTDLAKAQAKGEALELSQVEVFPKKWGFQDQASITDIAVVGVNLHGTFDHLLTASTCGGFDARYRNTAPYNNLVLGVGSRPFVGFHYASDGCAPPVFSDVAKAVATKLKSALPSWLVGTKSAAEKQMNVAMQPVENMGCRFGLCDLRRTATSIVLSADHRLAAVSDALGRVLLMDAYRGIILRIFKGYRDAQCSFVHVPDERRSKHRIGNKVALFLLIYSPKKGTLEIFTVQQGIRFCTFSASKVSRLIYNNYGLMGFATTSKSRFVCQFTTLLIDNDGQIKEVSVPFYYALNEKNNKKARDIHLFKKLKHLLNYSDGDDDSLIANTRAIYTQVKTLEYKFQILELLLGNDVPAELISDCVQFFLENFEEGEEDEKRLRTICQNSSILLNSYLFLQNSKNHNGESREGDCTRDETPEREDSAIPENSVNSERQDSGSKNEDGSSGETKESSDTGVGGSKNEDAPPGETKESSDTGVGGSKNEDAPPGETKESSDTGVGGSKNEDIPPGETKEGLDTGMGGSKNEDIPPGETKEGSDLGVGGETPLNLDSRELSNLQKFLDLSTLNHNLKSQTPKVEFSDTKTLSPAKFLSVFELNNPEKLGLKPNLDESLLLQVSEAIFKNYISGLATDLAAFEAELAKIQIETQDIFRLLIDYWVNRPVTTQVDLEKEMNNFLSLTLVLVKSADPEDLTPHYSSVSKFWDEVREILANSSRPFPALTAAILCKIAAHKIECQLSSGVDDEGIEVLSQENVEWGLLIGKLEDVSLLNIVLSNDPSTKFATLPKLKHEKTEVSLKYVLEKGRGSVSELVARWLSLCGLDPSNIVINDLMCKKSQESESSSEDDDDDEIAPVQDLPQQKVDEVNADQVFERLNLMRDQFPYSLDPSYLLSNMCWEYALAWQKDMQDLDKLDACIECLKNIPSSHIKEGLHYMVWNTHLKIIFESTCKLINKVGKLPKERLCKQDTGFLDYHIPQFLQTTTKFLDNYMDAVQTSYKVPKPFLQFEPIWENGSQPLVEIALQQNTINYDMLHLHYQLSFSLHLVTSLGIKHLKPINNLFESYMTGLFFNDFQTNCQINWNYADIRVQQSRTQFLFKVISASLETVTVTDNDVYAAEHVRWMSKCVTMGKLWNLDLDSLRRYQVVQLYTNGFDRFADSVFCTVQDATKLTPELLAVTGKRVSQFLATSPNLCENMSVLSTDVTGYMKQLDQEWCAPSSLKDVENLLRRCLACVDTSRREYRIGEMLLDGIETIQKL